MAPSVTKMPLSIYFSDSLSASLATTGKTDSSLKLTEPVNGSPRPISHESRECGGGAMTLAGVAPFGSRWGDLSGDLKSPHR
jgi:hypothetical protein